MNESNNLSICKQLFIKFYQFKIFLKALVLYNVLFEKETMRQLNSVFTKIDCQRHFL